MGFLKLSGNLGGVATQKFIFYSHFFMFMSFIINPKIKFIQKCVTTDKHLAGNTFKGI